MFSYEITLMELQEAKQIIHRLKLLASLVTVRQVINAGHEYIDAAGLSEWCISEGLATGDETLNLWWA